MSDSLLPSLGQSLRLLSLPPELLTYIIRMVLPRHFAADSSWWFDGRSTAPLRVCRQLHDLALDVVYRTSTFRLHLAFPTADLHVGIKHGGCDPDWSSAGPCNVDAYVVRSFPFPDALTMPTVRRIAKWHVVMHARGCRDEARTRKAAERAAAILAECDDIRLLQINPTPHPDGLSEADRRSAYGRLTQPFRGLKNLRPGSLRIETTPQW